MKNILTFLLLNASLGLFAQSNVWLSKVSPMLLDKVSINGMADCVIVLKDQADISAAKSLKTKEAKGQFVYQTLTHFAAKSQQNIIADLNSKDIDYQSFWVINALKVKVDYALLEMLANREEVRKILYNAPLTHHKPAEKGQKDKGGLRTVEWGISMIEADSVWNAGYTGQGVTVGGQDTGYDWEHPALKDKYRGWNGTTADHNYNWHDAIHQIDSHNQGTNPCGLNSNVPCDDDVHGTHTMGTMVGLDGSDQIGIAYSAKWVGVRNMERGYGTLTTYIESFQWFIAPTDLNNANPLAAKAPDVINNSWGCPLEEGCDTSNFATMEQVVINTKASGIVVVVSAGNDGSDCGTVNDPAAIFEASFSVGATDFTNNIAGFSSRGPVTVDGSNRMKPNVSAPGVFIRSCVPGGNYQHLSGTSMAGPHVAGAVALLFSAAPSLKGNVDSVEHILEMTAKPFFTNDGCGNDNSTSLPNNTFGYGRINIWEAVKFVLQNQQTATVKPQTSEIRVFPSPATDNVWIEVSNIDKPLVLSIYNEMGQMVTQQLLHQNLTQLPVNNYPKGVYFYSITNDKQVISGKWVKL